MTIQDSHSFFLFARIDIFDGDGSCLCADERKQKKTYDWKFCIVEIVNG